MALNRRNLMKLSAAGAVAIAMGGRAARAVAPVDEVRDAALAYFGAQGFEELPPRDLITGIDGFNGGLRYDETRPDTGPSGWITIQPAARVEDIAERERPGVLAGFNIIGLCRPPSEPPGALFGRVMDFCVNGRKLDPARMLFVSTELFRPYVERFDEPRAGQVLERPLAEATAAGDGSGFFAPRGHPDSPAQYSVGLYYPNPGASNLTATTYPPEGYLELGEFEIPPLDGDPVPFERGALGLERLAMAEGQAVPDFEETRLNLLRLIEDEAERTGKPLPPGYAMFASLEGQAPRAAPRTR